MQFSKLITKTERRKQEFQFLHENPLLKLPKRKATTVDTKSRTANVEETIKNIRLERRILEFVEPYQSERSLESRIPSKVEFLISQDDIVNRYKQNQKFDLKREQARGLTQNEQFDSKKKLLIKLDSRIQSMNQLSPMNQQWHSPFTLTQPQRYQQTSVKQIMESLENKDEQPSQNNDHRSFVFNKIFEEGQDDQMVLAAIDIDQVLLGYGPQLRSVLDHDKGEYYVKQSHTGNPKYLLRSNYLSRLKNTSCGRLDMIKEWNKLLKMDKLRPSKLQIKQKSGKITKLQTTDSQRQNGLTQSQFQNFRDFHNKVSQIVSKANQSQQRCTPISMILPQLVVRNSSNSASSSQKDLLQLGGGGLTGRKKYQTSSIKIKDDHFSELELQNDTHISKETFLTHCQIFWNVVRKEDEIVERVAQALQNGNSQITFQSFCQFHSVFIFQDWFSQLELQRFVFSFFMCHESTSITFIKVQGLLALLFNRIDTQMVKLKLTKLVDQMLGKILEKIHRPSAISCEVLQELIEEKSIPSELIIRLIYDC